MEYKVQGLPLKWAGIEQLIFQYVEFVLKYSTNKCTWLHSTTTTIHREFTLCSNCVLFEFCWFSSLIFVCYCTLSVSLEFYTPETNSVVFQYLTADSTKTKHHHTAGADATSAENY